MPICTVIQIKRLSFIPAYLATYVCIHIYLGSLNTAFSLLIWLGK